MRTFLIDDQGQFADAASPNLRSALNAWHLGNELTDYVIRNLGFIAVGGFDGSPHVRLRPDVVSPVAFAALMYWLSDRSPDRLMLSTLRETWQHELIGDKAAMSRKLARLVEARRSDRADDFLSRPADPKRLSRPSPLASLFAVQAEFRDWLKPDQMSEVLDGALKGRYAIMTADANLDNIVIDRVGPGFAEEANFWFARSIGNRLEDQPDQAYGAWLASTYRHTLSTGQATLDDVDAIVSWPNQGRMRYCYKRLLVPLPKQGDRLSVLCATLKDRRIDLRVKVG